MPELWSVREASESDADAIAEVHVASIRDLGSAAYGPEIIEAWAAPRDGSRYARGMAMGEAFFLAESAASEVLGFSSAAVVRSEAFIAVYVRGSGARRGIGSALLRLAEGALRERGATEIQIDASLNAVPFYEAHGFRSLGEDEHKLSSGCAMRCVRMAKALG